MVDLPLHQPMNMTTGEKAGEPRPRDGVHIDATRGIADVPRDIGERPAFDASREMLVMSEGASPMPFDAAETKWVVRWTKEALPLEVQKAQRLALAYGEIDQIRRMVVPPLESQGATYGLKLVFALLATHGSAGMKSEVKPVIEAEATPMGQTEAELTPTVIAQGVAWSIANETMEGMRRAFEAALAAATTVAELDAIPDLDFSVIRTALGLSDPI